MITIDEFKKIDNEARQKRPKIFYFTDREPKATKEDIEAVENILRCRLPIAYNDFLLNFSGGDYGLTNIFSMRPDSKWYIIKCLDYLPFEMQKSYVPFSDDQCGGRYLFKKESGQLLETVHYWNLDGGLDRITYANLFDYLIRFAH